jgi:hypothetical protein
LPEAESPPVRSGLDYEVTVEEAEALLRAARSAESRGDVAQAKDLHLRIISLFPRTPEADEAIHFLTNAERAEPQRVEQIAVIDSEQARVKRR